MTLGPIELDHLRDHIGITRGPSTAVLIDQARIDAFAETTEDAQWIHTDAERASSTPFGRTIAHGFLTLSFLSHVIDELLVVEGASHALNYGLDRVRFISPVPSGSRLTGTMIITDVRDADQHVDMSARVDLSIDDGQTLCCVAESLTRFQRQRHP